MLITIGSLGCWPFAFNRIECVPPWRTYSSEGLESLVLGSGQRPLLIRIGPRVDCREV